MKAGLRCVKQSTGANLDMTAMCEASIHSGGEEKKERVVSRYAEAYHER